MTSRDEQLRLVEECESDVQTPDCDCQRCVLFRTVAAAIREMLEQKPVGIVQEHGNALYLSPLCSFLPPAGTRVYAEPVAAPAQAEPRC
jgi:hypothetical protein